MSSNFFENPEGESFGDSTGLISRGTNDDDDISLNFSSDDQDDFIEDLDASDKDDDKAFDNDDQLILSSSDDGYGLQDEEADDDLDDDYDLRDALRSAGNFRPKNKRKTAASKSYWKRKIMRSTNRELDPEVRINLSQANEAFVRNDFQVALNLYLEVIKKDPKNFSAYKTLGEIYKQQGRLHKCCNAWLLAANIHPWDSQFWGNVAELSSELGHIDQAIYCYGRAIASDNTKNAKFILERAFLYKEKKQFGRALEGFQRVHQIYPADTSIIKNLASVYVEQKRVNDAINLYMRILDQNINPSGQPKQSIPKFGWAELNILCELYLQQHSWKIGIKVIKLVARWIQNRTDEKWWDEIDDDSEFDKRRFIVIKTLSSSQEAISKEKFYDLPIDIRFKLGSLRLGMEHKEEAMRHFEYLLEETEDIADLYFEAGKALEAHGFYEEALTFLTRASLNDEQNESSELVSLLGKCFLEVGDYIQAQQAYNSLLYGDPDNLDFKLALAETFYHLGESEKSVKLLEEVSIATEKNENQKGDKDEKTMENEIVEEDNLSLIKNKQLIKSKNAKLSEEERLELEDNAKRKVMEKYRRMERLEDAINKNEKVAVTAWMQLASQLVEMFMNVRIFFPRDKNRAFKGIVLYRRKKQMGIDEKLARVYNLYEGITNDDNYTRLFLTSTTDYRGLSYDIWFSIFVQYAMLLSRFDKNTEYATHIIDVAKDVSVFVQDKNKETILNMVRLIFGINQEEVGTVMTYIRHFLSANQFSPFVYKLFMCCFASGVESWETFANYNHQKFFLRQLKAYDSILSGKKITGMATITADLKNFKFNREHPELLYIYANLLGGSRSYVSSIVYLNRGYKEYKQDPMICIVLGLAHVHRSMQRLSNNRHMQLLQGISYILEYKELREKDASPFELQEIEYNFGRLFHMIGLTTAATHHYEKVLHYHSKLKNHSEYDLLVEAAYNLSLIYNINGNSMLARELTEKYLVV